MEGLMPTKRKPLQRNWRPGRFSDEAIELFLELERARQNPRIDPKFQDKSRQLALMLGLIDEWACSVCHVNDGSSHSGYPPGHLTDLAFWRVFAVRQQLLAIWAQRARDAVSPVEPAEPSIEG
jgi:hypothetical protein